MVIIALLASLLIVGLDQMTKWLVVEYLKPDSIPLLKIGGTEVINFTYCENTGMSFSLLEGKQLFLIIITSVFMVGLIVYLLSGRCKNKLMIWAIAMVIGGGIGNLIDRIANGFVVDFIDFKIINFAIFNVADIFAVCGAILLLIAFVIDEIKESKAKKAAASADKSEVSPDGAENVSAALPESTTADESNITDGDGNGNS